MTGTISKNESDRKTLPLYKVRSLLLSVSVLDRLLKPLAQIAALFPLAHLITCSLFLAGYAGTFGERVSTLFAWTDLFSLSFANLANIYLTAVIVPAVGGWLLGRSINNGNASVTAIISPSNAASLIVGACLIAPQVYFWFTGRSVQYSLVLDGIILLQIKSIFRLFEELGLRAGELAAGWIALVLCVTAFGRGMSEGEQDRYAPFSKFAGYTFSCNRSAILRPLSSHYLAVLHNNQRVIVDDKCAVLFSFPKVKTRN